MATLARWSGYLAIAAGVLVVVLMAIVAYDQESPAWFAFFFVVALLGAAVLGFQERTKGVTGQLGRASASLSALGAVGILALFAYSAVSGLDYSGGGASDPLAPFWIATAVVWFVGTIGYAVALIRAQTLSPVGAWLVLAGALVGLGVSLVLAEAVPAVALMVFALFGVGWILIGYAALRPAVPAT